jgi:hypothetical protein
VKWTLVNLLAVSLNLGAGDGLEIHPVYDVLVHDRMFVRYTNSVTGNLRIRIQDANGQTVKEYIDLEVPPGFHQILLDFSDTENGMYTIQMHLDGAGDQDFTETTTFELRS